MAAEYLMAFSEEADSENTDQFYTEIVEAGQRLIKTRPSMAPLFNYVNEVLLALCEGKEGAGDVKGQKELVMRVSSEYLKRSKEARNRIRAHMDDLIKANSTILIHSYSQTVVQSLVYAKSQGKNMKVIVTESRPVFEGRKTAEVLVQNEIRTTLIADMTSFSVLENMDLILVGCDTLCEAGIVNKTGTMGLAIAASHFNVPVYVLCEKNKMIPPAYMTKPDIVEQDPGEILEAPKGIAIYNIYFDVTHHSLVTGIITEDGIMTSKDAKKLLTGLKVSSELLKG
jgi:translation initiation factor 2B subunit (eIF-2B alpha/beta/delta family)